MLRSAIALGILCVIVAGCRSGGREWVMGSAGSVSKADVAEVEDARRVAAKYVGAWIDKDYKAMFDLQSRRAAFVDRYAAFSKVASVWRTKGFPQQAALTSESKKQIASSLTPLLDVTDEQAQILLMLSADKRALEDLKNKRWPEKVLFMRVVISSNRSLLMLAKENGDWRMLNAPGTLTADMLSSDLRQQLLR